jgi:hypothetical protein
VPVPSPQAAPFAGVRCADITSANVSWLWEPYLARGKLAVLDGDPGTGKSFVTIDLACRITRGLPMPGTGAAGKAASVLLLNAEDDARDTIRPRVLAANGDPDRVRVFAAPGIGLERVPRFPEDFARLEAAVRETRAALVVIDPMMAFFPPDVSANNTQSITTALLPLSALAASTGACVLLVRHLRKSGGASAIYRGMGSIGILGAVRTGLMIARHPDDADLRVLSMTKTNIGPPGQSLGFRLARNEASGQTVIDWTGPLDVTADDLFGACVPLRAGFRTRERAAEWLREFLANGERRASEVFEAARAAGIPERTLKRVKATVGVQSNAVKSDGKLEWWWRDPKAERASRDEIAEIERTLMGSLERRRAARAEPPRPLAPKPPDDFSHVPMG